MAKPELYLLARRISSTIINHTLKESALRAEIQGEEREATIENLQRANKNLMGSVLQAGAQVKDELKQAADEERRASEEKLNSALRANAMLQTISGAGDKESILGNQLEETVGCDEEKENSLGVLF
ncbi:hypothetical protein C8J57DRAFT_1240487 [Mycena rebaudengoi]|nr:hypothetical protein C8J57DRAFT_1240487 [Mycena rebaudengoi]